MEEGLRGAKNQPSREEGKVPSENGRLERAQRLLGFRILRDCENARQAGKRVAAQRIVNELPEYDIRVFIRKSDTAQRPFT